MSELTVGVVRQDDVGERRVALVPESVARLAAAGRRHWSSRRAPARRRLVPRRRVRGGRRHRRPGREPCPTRADVVAVRRARRTTRRAARRAGADRPAAAAGRPGAGRRARRRQGDRDQPRPAAAHPEPGAVDGRADLAGQRRRLQGGAGGGRRVRRVLPDADHRGRHRPAGARCWCSAPASPGCRPSAPPRRLGARRHRLRRPAGRAGRRRARLGATFLDLGAGDAAAGDGRLRPRAHRRGAAGASRRALAARSPGFDVVITTAQVPGRRPPLLVTAEALDAMRPGSVVVDLAAEPARRQRRRLGARRDRRHRRRRHA